MADVPKSKADLVAMLGGALVVLGVVVLGFINTITDNPHVEQTNDAGEVVAEPVIPEDIRAWIILIGLALWLLYGLYKVAAPAEPVETTAATPADD